MSDQVTRLNNVRVFRILMNTVAFLFSFPLTAQDLLWRQSPTLRGILITLIVLLANIGLFLSGSLLDQAEEGKRRVLTILHAALAICLLIIGFLSFSRP